MILDEEAPGGICDERGWPLDLFVSADEALGRAVGEASAALGVLLGHAGPLVALPLGLHEAGSAGGVEGASDGVGEAGGKAERERVTRKNPAPCSTTPWSACSCTVRGSSKKAPCT